MQYQGYGSYDEQISQTQQYLFENVQNQTYEQSSKLISVDALHDITNKIKISDALKTTFKKSINDENVSECGGYGYGWVYKNKGHKKSVQRVQQQKILDQPLRLTQKDRKKSLLYFQQKQTQIVQIKQNILKENFYNKNTKSIQQDRIRPLNQNKIKTDKTAKERPSSLYFVKNLQHEPHTNRQMILTNRSGYELRVSQIFVDKIITKTQVCQNGQISLKQKISQKLTNDKKNKRLKTCQLQQQRQKYIHKKSQSRLYKPMCPIQNSNLVLSTQPFHNRQAKTMQNRKIKVQRLKTQLVQKETKQCTFKPKTNKHSCITNKVK